MPERSVREHNDRIDYLKAFAAILVQLGHVLTYHDGLPEPLLTMNTLIYAVHVPLFFTAAGYLCHRQPIGSYYLKKARRILVPFFFFALLKILFYLFSGGDFTRETVMGMLSDELLYGKHIWFCYSIFLVFLCSPLLWKRDGSVGVARPGLLLAAACAVGDTTCGLLELSFPHIFQIKTAIYYFPYFTIGYAICQYREAFFAWVRSRRGVLSVVGLCVAAVYLLLVRAALIRETFFPAKLPTAFSLMFFLWLLSGVIPPGQKVLKYIGDHALQFMLLDSVYRYLLFRAAYALGRHGVWVVVPITLLDLLLSGLTCVFVEKVPGLRFLFGLSPSAPRESGAA